MGSIDRSIRDEYRGYHQGTTRAVWYRLQNSLDAKVVRY